MVAAKRYVMTLLNALFVSETVFLVFDELVLGWGAVLGVGGAVHIPELKV